MDDALTMARQITEAMLKGDVESVTARFDAAMAAALSQEQLKAAWEASIVPLGDYQGEAAHTVQEQQGHTSVTLTLGFQRGAIDLVITLSPERRVSALFLRPAHPPLTFSADEQEVTFQVGDAMLYGTLLIPAGAKDRLPAMVLISGSGPTDRDGNSSLLVGNIDSHKTLARILADAGIASLRYDKLGIGKTGIASLGPDPSAITFDPYVDSAVAAYQFLAARREIDSARIGLLGHSEGGLIALAAADPLKDTPTAALILVMPLSKPMLTIMRQQLAAQTAGAVAAQAMTQEQADANLAELDRIIAQVAREATLPRETGPEWTRVFPSSALKFLQSVNRYDPARIAQDLPKTLPILILCGEKDQQVLCEDVALLAEAFQRAGNTAAEFVRLPNVNHVFKVVEGVPNPASDYTDPSKPFSPEAAGVITEFLRGALKL